MEQNSNDVTLSNFEVILKTSKNRYFFRIPKLGLIASGDSVEKAYQSLTEKKEEFLKEVQGAGLTLPENKSVEFSGNAGAEKSVAGNLKNDIVRFLVKTVIIGILFLIIIEVSGSKLNKIAESQSDKFSRVINKASNLFENKSNQALNKIHGIIPSKPGHILEKELIRAANREIDLERREKIIQSIRMLIKKWKPVVSEIRPLFDE